MITASVILITAAAVALAGEQKKPAKDPAAQTASCDANACPEECCTTTSCCKPCE